MKDLELFDVIIIGGGAAGMAAAVWCDELGLKAMILESNIELGGQLLWTYNAIKNYLGVETENGREMRDIFLNQIQTRKFILKTESEVIAVDIENKQITLKNNESFLAKAIVIAGGIRRRKLGIAGEDNFKGYGIIESGKRDADLVDGKRVCVVGGGDAALENALILSETASEVILIHRGQNFRARSEFVEQVLKNKKIKILTETVITKINGNEKIQTLEVKSLKTAEIIHLPIDALLIRIGVEPNSSLFREKLAMDKQGYIKIDSNCETNIKNIFAVGDIANPISPTISSAVGMGATSAKIIFNRLN